MSVRDFLRALARDPLALPPPPPILPPPDLERRAAPCCGYQWLLGENPAHNIGPIFWNPYNHAVCCHHCGARFEMVRS